MMQGDRKARGASSRMCRSPWASRSAISAKDALRPNRRADICFQANAPRATSQSAPLLLLDPGIGQGLGEAGDREVRRRGAIDDRRNDARRKEGKGGEQ